MKTRRIPSSLASVVQGLELRQPNVVTRALLSEIAEEVQTKVPVDALAERLVRSGWLLSLRTRDAWEFAPAANAGPYGSDDPWIELRAILRHRPDAPVAVAYESALWEYSYTTHQPTKPVLAHRRSWRPPRALSARTVSYDWRLPPTARRGLPVWQPATTLVAAADRPSAQGDWANADEWLPAAFHATTAVDILIEADERKKATLTRLGYLAEWSDRYDIADAIEERLLDKEKPLPVVFLGPRDTHGLWVNRWRLYDALLPKR